MFSCSMPSWRHEIHPDEVFAFFPGNDYEYGDFKGACWNYHWADIEGRDVAATLRHVGITPRTPSFAGIDPADWRHFLNASSRAFREPPRTRPSPPLRHGN
jgi:hypothetical protein